MYLEIVVGGARVLVGPFATELALELFKGHWGERFSGVQCEFHELDTIPESWVAVLPANFTGFTP